VDTFTKTKDSSSTTVDKDKKFLEEKDLRSQADDVNIKFSYIIY
jgi:hypothetical protein